MKKETKEQNIPYSLHESEFMDFKIKGNDLIFKVAIDCCGEESFGIEAGYFEKLYIYEIICHNYVMKFCNYTEDKDLTDSEILCFKVVNDEYVFAIQDKDDFLKEIDFCFDCESIEWKPIKLVTIEELHEMDLVEYKLQ